jgi:TolB-like protein/tetratricopeptide (TPR) repeat protein
MGVDELGSRRLPPAAVRFGEFRLDPVRAEFTRSGDPVALRPKTYALLGLFAASPGKVLGKDELLAALWPNVVVAEGSLSQCVTELRAALGEDGANLIRTVARQGYRFDAEVLADPAPELGPPEDKPSIAVLPFQNLSGDPERDYFADGLVQEIITALSRQRSLFVIARNSSFVYKGRAVDVKQVGRELGVRYVLEGSVRREGDRVRISGQLVDASTGAQIWGDRFEGGMEDIFDLQDRITSSVVVAIWRKLEYAEIERAKRKRPGNLHAYDYYLRGLALYYQMNSRERTAEALGLFEKAIELEPEFALAYAAAANCYGLRKASSWMIDAASEVREAERLARQGVALGRDDAFVLGACGSALAYVVGDLDAGAALLDSALALNPNLADAWMWGGWIKIWLGEPDEAVARFERAVRLSLIGLRTYGLRYAMAHAHFFAGRYEEASSWAAMAMRNRSDIQPVLLIDAASNAFADRSARARKSMARLRELYPALRLSNVRHVLGPYRRTEDVAKYTEGLRRAGLPE